MPFQPFSPFSDISKTTAENIKLENDESNRKTEWLAAAHRGLTHPVDLNVISSNFISSARSAWPAPPQPGLPPMPRMMQMALLTALMTDDNILLLVRDVFTFSARHWPENTRIEAANTGGGGRRSCFFPVFWIQKQCVQCII